MKKQFYLTADGVKELEKELNKKASLTKTGKLKLVLLLPNSYHGKHAYNKDDKPFSSEQIIEFVKKLETVNADSSDGGQLILNYELKKE